MPFKPLEVGQYESFVNEEEQISVTRWKDSTYVIFITNYTSTEEETRYFRRGSTEATDMPMVAFDYRGNMIYVDQFGRNSKLYTILRRVSRWWLTIFFFFIDIVIVNSWKIFIHNNNKLSKRKASVSCWYLH